MMTSNPFPTSRESVLAMFTPAAQARRIQPDARTADLFLLLHGMLFTHIQLDDFAPTHARFVERLSLEGAEEREWIMMAMINLGAVLEYGRNDGAIRKTTFMAALGGRVQTASEQKVTAVVSRTEDLKIGDSTEEEKKMDIDVDVDLNETESKSHNAGGSIPQILSSDSPELSHSFRLALDLTLTTLSYALRNPWRKANAFAQPSLNPYITVILTYLSTLFKHSSVLALMERSVPWDDLAAFFNTIPRSIVAAELELGAKGLTHGCSALPEDWCLRGTEWMRRVYERGYWKPDAGSGEVDVLDTSEESADGATDGIIEEDEEGMGSGRQSVTGRRWVRSFRAGVHLVRAVDGFDWDKAEKRWKVEGALRDKVQHWKEIDHKERQAEEERRMRGGRWADDMEIDEGEVEEEVAEEEDSDDEEDSEQVKELKVRNFFFPYAWCLMIDNSSQARRRHFRSLLLAAQRGGSPPPRRRLPARRRPLSMSTRAPLHVVCGYSILVVDTNILLSSLNLFSSLVDSLRWTVVVPLAGTALCSLLRPLTF
jgi:protein SMG6